MSTMVKIDSQKLISICEIQELKMWWVAEMAQIHRSTLRRWMQGKGGRAQRDKIARLAAVLQVDVMSISL